MIEFDTFSCIFIGGFVGWDGVSSEIIEPKISSRD
jgi:hypothetical protein